MKTMCGSLSLSSMLVVLGCMVMFLIPAESANAVASLDSNAISNLSFGTNSGRANDIFDFPADHFLHQPQEIVNNTELFMEWLYWTGSLMDVDSDDLYGIQYTLFHLNILPGLIAYANHVAISDINESQHSFYGYATPPYNANITNGIDEIKGSYWRYSDNQTTLTRWNDLDEWSIETKGSALIDDGHYQNVSMNLTMINDKSDYYIEGPTGVNEQRACLFNDSEYMAGRSYYYSHPAMNTTGTLVIDGRNIKVQGDSWFDHQWGGFGKCFSGWDWFSLRLDNGSYIMLYSLKDQLLDDIPSQRGLTYIDPNGNITWWQGEDAANLKPIRWWKSEQLGIVYPLDWILWTPVGKFAVEPYFDDQVMDVFGSRKYWEGIVRIRKENLSGEQIGTGYMELIGYAPITSQIADQTSVP